MSWIDLMIKILADYKHSSGWDNRLYFSDLAKLSNRQARKLSEFIYKFGDHVKSLNKCNHEFYDEDLSLNIRVCKECGCEQFGYRPFKQRDPDSLMDWTPDEPIKWENWK